MQDAQLISQAGQVESLASDGLVSVSTGAGQPQKNMELAKFADSLGSSVPLQQTSSQVNITGLYARTSDGKMVELTKASVANVVAGLYHKGEAEDLDDLKNTGVYIATTTTLNIPVKDFGVVHVIKSGIYTYQQFSSLNNRGYYTRAWNATAWTPWNRIDNFGYNTLAELSSGVAGLIGFNNTLRYVSDTLSNCNDAQPQTIHSVFQATNRPTSMTTHLLITLGNSSMKLQYASDNTKNVYYRTMYEGKWKEWTLICGS